MPAIDELVVELQSRGARLEVTGQAKGRRGGAGPADAKPFVLDGLAVTVPTMADFVADSPYSVRQGAAGGYVVMRSDVSVAPVAFPARPRFYDLSTADGVPYWHIATLHATDVLASTIVQTCIHWGDPRERCKYCGIGISLANGTTIATKTPEQLTEVAEAAVRLDGVRHFTLTMGTLNTTDKGARYMAECVRALKAAVDLPIAVQFEPPDDLDLLAEVKAAGADSIGLHIESFDPEVRQRVIPGKARISIERYFEAFRAALEAFGPNQVSSYVIVGLGESEESILAGCRRLIDAGVYPFVVPLRPIVGTEMEHVLPPPPEVMHRIYRTVGAMLAESDVRAAQTNAGCVRCGACSALAAFRLQDAKAASPASG